MTNVTDIRKYRSSRRVGRLMQGRSVDGRAVTCTPGVNGPIYSFGFKYQADKFSPGLQKVTRWCLYVPVVLSATFFGFASVGTLSVPLFLAAVVSWVPFGLLCLVWKML